jgi:hypothetical protein
MIQSTLCISKIVLGLSMAVTLGSWSMKSCSPHGETGLVVNESKLISRKQFISTNILGVVDMNGRFVYILSGWEGAAGDARVLDSALEGDFSIPEGKYYLADAGS